MLSRATAKCCCVVGRVSEWMNSRQFVMVQEQAVAVSVTGDSGTGQETCRLYNVFYFMLYYILYCIVMLHIL